MIILKECEECGEEITITSKMLKEQGTEGPWYCEGCKIMLGLDDISNEEEEIDP